MPRIDTRRVWGPLCVVLAILVIAATPQQASPDKLTPQNRDYDQKHILLDLDFDFANKSVSGTCEITLEVLRDEFDRILLHSEDTRVFDIRIRTGGSGQAFPARSFRVSDGLLAVDLGRIFPKGQELTLEIDYESVPTRGLYFFAPTETHPEIPTQVWSQGEARNNRHWFPCYDQPDDRITSELIARVPAEMDVISNGVLDSKETSGEGKTATYHFKMQKSHVPYLVSVIAGEFDHQTTEWEGIPLHTYVPEGRGDTVDITFGRTEKMMKFFSDYTGLKYPYSRYSQTTVWQFMHGGMENTMATTLNLRALHDERAHLDYSADGLIAHELAHQWFGDLITCVDWNEMWLNEGFATYFTDLFFEDFEGKDNFLVRRRRSANWVRRSTTESRKRIREAREKEAKKLGISMDRVPLELPAGNNYAKGASVLHLLRQVMGDDKFREGIRKYVSRRRDTCATSEQLREDLESVHGSSLLEIFDDWVYGSGYPELEVTWSWLAEEKTGVMVVKQVQDESSGLFRVPVKIAFHHETPNGLTSVRKTIKISKKEEEFRFPLDAEPAIVRFDEGDTISKSLKFPKELDKLAYQVLHDPDVTGRLDAIAALREKKEEATRPLARALIEDPAKQVRRSAARALGSIQSDEALRALLAALEDDEPMVRGAAAGALGNHEAEKVEKILITRLTEDRSFAVQAAAARALGKCKSTAAKEPLLAALKRGSYRQGVEVAAMNALAQLGDASTIPAVVEAVTGMTDSLGRSSVRGGAIRSMVSLGKGDLRVKKALLDLLDHPSRWTRFSAARSLDGIAGIDTLTILLEKVQKEKDDRVKRGLRDLISKIAQVAGSARKSPAGEEELAKLAAQAESLEEEAKQKSLEAKLAEMEARKARLEIEIEKLRGRIKGDAPPSVQRVTR